MTVRRVERVVNALGDGVAWLLSAQWRWVLVLLVVVASLAYCSGKGAGARSLRLEEIGTAKKVNADSIRLVAKARELTQREVAVALRESAAARAVYRTASARVRVLTDSSVSVDNAPPVFVGIPVVSLLRSGTELARTDSLATVKLQADVVTCGNQNALYIGRIRLLEEEVKLIKPSRCGFKCGVVATLSALAAISAVVLAAQ